MKMSEKIYSALLGVMRDIGIIKKDRKNQIQKYNFRGIEDAYNALQPALIKNGVIVVPNVVKSEREERKSKNGGLIIYTVLTVEFTFFAVEDGSSVKAVTIGEGMDTSDKSANKAMSAAFKYAVFQVFVVPTEMIDPERDHHEIIQGTITPEQIDIIDALIDEVGADRAKFMNVYNINHLYEMPTSQYEIAISMLNRKKAAK